MRKKKYKVGSDEMGRVIIEKMLEKYNINFDYLLKHSTIDEVPWYDYYTFTTEEAAQFKAWVIEFLQKECTPKRTLKQAEKDYAWFYLEYGLKIKDD